MLPRPLLLLLTVALAANLLQAQHKGTFDYGNSDPFAGGESFTMDFGVLSDSDWCYPLAGAKVISEYGSGSGRRHRHSGTDLKTKARDTIRAAFSGIVTMSDKFAAYGNCITIRHDSGLVTLYSHNVKNLVNKGDYVKAGTVIALTGRTGRATTEHLHFEVRVGKRHYNSGLVFDHKTHQLKKQKLKFYKNGTVKALPSSY